MLKQLKQLREHLPASIVAVLIVLVGALAAIQLASSNGSADGFECPADITSTDIKAGDFSPSERTAVVVREVDFRGPKPVVFYHVQWVETNQTLKVGPDVLGKAQNRDAWEVGNDIQNASCVAANLALADAQGNITDATVWLQIECPNDELVQQARDAGLTVKDWNDDPNVANWFIQVTEKVDAKFVIVCDDTGAPVTSTTAAPATTTTAVRQTTTVPPPAKPTCDVMDAKTNQVVPKGTLVVKEVVDFSRRTITVEVTTLSEDTPESIKGSVHTNLWWGYCSDASANEGADSQVAERMSEAAIPGSWADGFKVTRK